MQELLIRVGHGKVSFVQHRTRGGGDGYIFLRGPEFALWSLHAELTFMGWPAWIRNVGGLHLMVPHTAKEDIDFLMT